MHQHIKTEFVQAWACESRARRRERGRRACDDRARPALLPLHTPEKADEGGACEGGSMVYSVGWTALISRGEIGSGLVEPLQIFH